MKRFSFRTQRPLLWHLTEIRDTAIVMGCCGMFFAPDLARACTTIVEPHYVGSPEDGATDVPTDVEPTFVGDLLWLNASSVPTEIEASLVPSSGAPIGAKVEHPYVSDYTVTPDAALAPNTLYTLNLSWTTSEGPGTWAVQFTTGAGPYEGAAAPPSDAFLQHYQLKAPPQTSCSPWETGTCVALPEGLQVEARQFSVNGALQEPYLYRDPFFINLSGIDQGTPFECVELRTRAPNGQVSDPVVLCGSEAPLFELEESEVVCTAEGLPPSALDSGDDDSQGCRVGSKSAEWVGLLALVFGFTRRHARGVAAIWLRQWPYPRDHEVLSFLGPAL